MVDPPELLQFLPGPWCRARLWLSSAHACVYIYIYVSNIIISLCTERCLGEVEGSRSGRPVSRLRMPDRSTRRRVAELAVEDRHTVRQAADDCDSATTALDDSQ